MMADQLRRLIAFARRLREETGMLLLLGSFDERPLGGGRGWQG
jgi:hypothetical protein